LTSRGETATIAKYDDEWSEVDVQDRKTTWERQVTTRRGWPPEIVDKVFSLALDGLTPPEILRRLDADLARGVVTVDKLPDLRTIQRWVKELSALDRSGRWRLTPAAEAADAFALTARVEVMTETEGRVSEISNETESWLLTIHAVAPDLDPVSAHRLARLYLARGAHARDTGDLDAWLGFRPWQSDAAAARYEAAVAAGWIKPPPSGLNLATRVFVAAGAATASGGQFTGQSPDLRWVGPLVEADAELDR
jgi:hypothetical protein